MHYLTAIYIVFTIWEAFNGQISYPNDYSGCYRVATLLIKPNTWSFMVIVSVTSYCLTMFKPRVTGV